MGYLLEDQIGSKVQLLDRLNEHDIIKSKSGGIARTKVTVLYFPNLGEGHYRNTESFLWFFIL